MKQIRTPEQLRRDGWKALAQELGTADALRFLAEYSAGQGDYTSDRKQWATQVSADELFVALDRQTNRAEK